MSISNNSDQSSNNRLYPEKTSIKNTKKERIFISTGEKPWIMMIIDDEKMLHALTRMVFEGFTFSGRKLEIISAYSGKDAKKLLDKHPDTHILLLDVVMETDDAGLQFVHYVRNELKNKSIRIILRTGQPDEAPEDKVISEYEINDYKEKSDLTAQKLITAVTASLRTYNDLERIEQLVNEINKKNQQLEYKIEERKHSEEKMRQLSNALEQTADLIMITNKDGIIEYVNQGFERVTGYSKVEVQGKKANILKSKKQAIAFYKILWESILKGEIFSEIFINRKKDGKYFYEEKTISPLKDGLGNITHFIATGKDISNKMLAQKGTQYNYVEDTQTILNKTENRNNYQFYKQEHNDNAIKSLVLESQLRNALEKEEFLLHYQPQLDLKTGYIICLEALLGWQQHGLDIFYSTTEIFPILEKIGLIIPVGEWLLRTACQQGKKWLASSLSLQHIAVNFSLIQFKQQDLLQKIEQILNETEFQPEHLILEINERLLTNNVTGFSNTLKNLHQMGIKLSINNFGTGYSSINSLKRLPIDMIKIDRSVVNHITKNNLDDALICSGIITLAHGLNRRVIAEGVETIEQLAILQAHNFDGIQGNLCTKPLSVDKIKIFLQKNYTTNIKNIS
jgi:PAS domain S-box-containing protein